MNPREQLQLIAKYDFTVFNSLGIKAERNVLQGEQLKTVLLSIYVSQKNCFVCGYGLLCIDRFKNSFFKN